MFFIKSNTLYTRSFNLHFTFIKGHQKEIPLLFECTRILCGLTLQYYKYIMEVYWYDLSVCYLCPIGQVCSALKSKSLWEKFSCGISSLFFMSMKNFRMSEFVAWTGSSPASSSASSSALTNSVPPIKITSFRALCSYLVFFFFSFTLIFCLF